MYIAVVVPKDGRSQRRPHGDLASFIGASESDVIEQALRARDEWSQTERGKARGYFVLIGELTARVDIPVRWEKKPLYPEAESLQEFRSEGAERASMMDALPRHPFEPMYMSSKCRQCGRVAVSAYHVPATDTDETHDYTEELAASVRAVEQNPGSRYPRHDY